MVMRAGLAAPWTLMASGPVEEFASAAHRLDALDEEAEVLGHLGEVEALAVHDEQRAVGVIVEVSRIGLREPPQVTLVEALLDRVAALLHALHQRVNRG